MNAEPNRTSDLSSSPPEAAEEAAGRVGGAPPSDGGQGTGPGDSQPQQAALGHSVPEDDSPQSGVQSGSEAADISHADAPAPMAADQSATGRQTSDADSDVDTVVNKAEADESDIDQSDVDDSDVEDSDVEVQPLEDLSAQEDADGDLAPQWYILKVQVNREESIRDALQRRVKIEGLERYFVDIIVPTEDVAEFTKTGKKRIVKRKLYPGYIMVNMVINDDTWFLVRETPGIGDFTGSAGKPTPMDSREVERILRTEAVEEGEMPQVKTAIPFKAGDRVRVKDGYFQNFEGDVESIDEANGRVTVMINIFGRSTPVELEHWQIEAV